MDKDAAGFPPGPTNSGTRRITPAAYPTSVKSGRCGRGVASRLHASRPATGRTPSSREDVVDHGAGDVGQAEVAAGVAEGQAFVVDAQQVQDRGVEVVD